MSSGQSKGRVGSSGMQGSGLGRSGSSSSRGTGKASQTEIRIKTVDSHVSVMMVMVIGSRGSLAVGEMCANSREIGPVVEGSSSGTADPAMVSSSKKGPGISGGGSIRWSESQRE